MKPADTPAVATPEEVKQCCASLYESDIAKLLLGDSFHPGGLRLTERIGFLLQLGPHSRVLDVAAGRGATAIFLEERFGCEVIGIDYGADNMQHANEEVMAKGRRKRVRFQQGDAECLPFPENSFDAVVCECALCTFPDKARAVREFARVLRAGGKVGISDLTRTSELPKELDGLLAWIACIADAQPVENYMGWFRSAGLVPHVEESHDEALAEMAQQVQGKLLGIEIMSGLKKIVVLEHDLTAAKQMAKAAIVAIQEGQLGYAVMTAKKL